MPCYDGCSPTLGHCGGCPNNPDWPRKSTSMTLNIPELRALVAAATPGDWNADHLEPSGLLTMVSSPSTWVADTDVTADRLGEANAAFIAAARTAVPELLDRVEALEAELEERECDVHARIRAGYDKTVADAWRAEVAKLTAALVAMRTELVQLRAELARMRPIVDAAIAWRVGRDRNIVGTAPSGGQRSARGVALIEAIDAGMVMT